LSWIKAAIRPAAQIFWRRVGGQETHMCDSITPGHAGCGRINAFRMMERLGIEPGGGVVPALGLRYATVLHRCATCASPDACSAWLDHASGHDSLPPLFCPSSDLLFELQFDQPGWGLH
jgi:hypothetical protein